MNFFSRARWPWIVAGAVVSAQVVAIGFVVARVLHGPSRNLAIQVLLGGLIVLAVLGATAVRYGSFSFSRAASRLALLGLVALALLFSGLRIYRVAPMLTVPVDLGSWSEPMFVLDIIKLRTGASLYMAPGESNSNTYTFGAPVLSYTVAKLFGQSDSIVFYRYLLQGYLALAAIVSGWAAWRLLHLTDRRPEGHSRLWLIFFVLASYVLATNGATNFYTIYLHNDPLAVLVGAAAFALMVEHAVTRHPRWLRLMAVMPALGFLVKQYLAILAVVYLVYLWLDGSHPLRRVLWFAVVSFGMVAAVLGACLAVWGDPFRYWVFEVIATHVVSFERMFRMFAEAAVFLLPGFAAGGLLLRRASPGPVFGMWVGWLVMVLGAAYTSGLSFHPSHFGPATVIGGCLFLPLLAQVWPEQATAEEGRESWLRLALCWLVVLALFFAWGFALPARQAVSADLERYVAEIEKEFTGQDPEKVLMDTGDWIYLRHDVVATDRLPILLTHRRPYDDLKRRVREQRFARILVRAYAPELYSYDAEPYGQVHKGIREEMLRYYREVRRIPAARGMESWRYRNTMMGEVSVLEPIPLEGR